VLRRRNFFQGRAIRGAGVKDIMWLDPSGREMTDEGWSSRDARALGVLLAGDAIDEVDERGRRIVGDTLLVLYNASPEPVPFVLPADAPEWSTVIDTADPRPPRGTLPGGERFTLAARAIAVLKGAADRERQTERRTGAAVEPERAPALNAP
jgi:isoamylase